MKNYLQNGHIVRVTSPAGGIASGDALIVGSIFGIAAYSSAEGDPVELETAVQNSATEAARWSRCGRSKTRPLWPFLATGRAGAFSAWSFIGRFVWPVGTG
jgi:hypothetical protein